MFQFWGRWGEWAPLIITLDLRVWNNSLQSVPITQSSAQCHPTETSLDFLDFIPRSLESKQQGQLCILERYLATCVGDLEEDTAGWREVGRTCAFREVGWGTDEVGFSPTWIQRDKWPSQSLPTEFHRGPTFAVFQHREPIFSMRDASSPKPNVQYVKPKVKGENVSLLI